MSDLAQAILAAAGLATALGVLWRWLRLSELLRGTRRLTALAGLQETFLLDWNGEPGRPGVDARLSFPERMAEVEDRTRVTERRTADLSHTFRGEMTSRLELLAQGQERLELTVGTNGSGIDRLTTRLDAVENHVTHSDEQLERLRVDVDRRLSSLSGDLLRAETYRAALHELGLELEPPPRKNPLATPPYAPLEDPE